MRRFVALFIVASFALAAPGLAGQSFRLHLPREGGEAVRLYVAFGADGGVLRAFAFHEISFGRAGGRWGHPWTVEAALKLDGRRITGEVAGETGIQPNVHADPVPVKMRWTVDATDDGKSQVVHRLPDTPVGDHTLITLWCEWGVPHVNRKEDTDGFVGTNHVQDRGHIYRLPLFTMPLTGKPEGYDGAYLGTIDVGACPNTVPTALGPLPLKWGDGYWKGRIVGVDLAVRDGRLSGEFRADMRRGNSHAPFDDAMTMGVYRYQVDGTVIGNVVLGRYETQRTEPDDRFVQPKGLVFGYLGRPSTPYKAPKLAPILTREPDPALVKRAAEEARTPVHPGEEGIEGQAGAYGPTRFWHTYLPAPSFVYAPILSFQPAQGATAYRFTVTPEKEREPIGSVFGQKACANLSDTWDAVRAKRGSFTATAVPLDNFGRPLGGERSTVTFRVRPSFRGPYYASLREVKDVRERLLAHLRWLKSSTAYAPFRQEFLPGMVQAQGGKNYGNRPVVGGGVISSMALLAKLTEDPSERAEALGIARAAGDWVLALTGGPHDLPDYYYKCLFWYTLYPGYGYLDLYGVTGEDRWREAALRLCRAYAKLQDPSGAWPFVCNGYGRGAIGVGTRRGWDGQDPRDAQWQVIGAADFLHWFGRVRADLKTDEFLPVERRAWEWVKSHSARTFLWKRRGGYNEAEYIVNGRYPSLLVLWLLDYAKPGWRDLKLAREIVRFCEDTCVHWDRDGDGRNFLPRVDEFTAPRYTLADPGAAARYGLIYLKLHRLTKDPLDLAKGEALLGSVLATQHPDGLMYEGGKADPPESIFTRYAEGQNTSMPHLAEAAWRLHEAFELMRD